MACERVEMPAGGFAIVCGTRDRKRCSSCGQRADLLCDWKVPGKKSGTCDKPICSACTHSPARDKDLCKEHASAWEARRATRLAMEARA